VSGEKAFALPADPALRLAVTSVALTAGIGAVLAWQRAGIADRYAIPIYRHIVLYQDVYSVAPFLAVLLLALLPAGRTQAAHFAQWCGRHVLLLAAATVVVLAAGTQLAYHGVPLAMDEYAVLFQAKVFATGHLAGAMPPPLLDWLVPPLQHDFFRVDPASGAVASGYWPGFALLLTPFAALGAPWLLNPLLGGATLLVVHRLARELFGDETSAGYAVLFTLASPAVTIDAISLYSMPAHLVLNGVFMLLLLRATPARALAAGVIGSLALVLHNPVPHLLFAAPWIVWLALRPERARVLGALFAGYLPLCMLLGFGWSAFMRDFGAGAALPALVAPADMTSMFLQRLGGVLNWVPRPGVLASQLMALAKLWLWAAPALVAAAALGAWRMRHAPGPWRAMAASLALTFAAYFFVRLDPGHGWGARYLHSVWLVLPLFAVAALREKPEVGSYAAACALLSLVLLTPFRATQVERFIARHLEQLPTAQAAGAPRIVFINPQYGYYSWDLVQNDPFLRGPELRMLSRLPAQDRALMAQRFPQYRLLTEDARGSLWVGPPPSKAGTN